VSTLRITGAVAATVGAAVSLLLLMMTGKNTPPLLLLMFIAWVALPFVVLLIGIIWKRFSDQVRSAFSTTSIVITLVSIAVYSYFTLWPLFTTPARTWLLTPGFSLVVTALVFLYVRSREMNASSRRE
jgi:hypothetical protein